MLTESEHAFIASLEGQQVEVHRGGWPDFFVVYPDGTYKFIEVKSPNEKVPDHQQKLHDAFRRCGIRLVVWRSGRRTVNSKPVGKCQGCGEWKPLRKDNRPICHEPCGTAVYFMKPIPIEQQMSNKPSPWKVWSDDH